MPVSHAPLTGWRGAPANLPQRANHVISQPLPPVFVMAHDVGVTVQASDGYGYCGLDTGDGQVDEVSSWKDDTRKRETRDGHKTHLISYSYGILIRIRQEAWGGQNRCSMSRKAARRGHIGGHEGAAGGFPIGRVDGAAYLQGNLGKTDARRISRMRCQSGDIRAGELRNGRG
ncbi:hypothetical protein GX51_00049 [Blastomyces parvus]|uniref:Uncharacterized protein n=1 Tax=Blastomyces parvus TaxID=2060905 RepID=A0A2B7XNR6_9EURO|nr:hypothetical protein GX51_00049 [Blastomyces parvus]